ncbi:MAG: sugar phosphate nucleotidyltransferase [Acidimicrobiales bacterium]
MAGGEGTRLRPLTSTQPKPMLPMVNRPLMERVVSLLRQHGLTDIVVTVGRQAEAVRSYFGNGLELGVDIAYVTEGSPLGTAGCVRNAMEKLAGTFLVISGDVLTDIDLSEVVKFHRDKGALATVAVKSVANPLEFGVVVTRQDGSVERFLEKPSWGEVFSDTVNTGIYLFEPEIFDFIPPGAVDFSSDVFPLLVEQSAGFYGCQVNGYWQDVGTLEAYMSAHRDILDRRVDVQVPGSYLQHGIWVGKGVRLDETADVIGPAVIGDYCEVGAGAVIGEHTVLGPNVRVGPDAHLGSCVVHDNTFLGPGVRLQGCAIGRGSDLRRGARVEEGTVIGDQCSVGEHALVRPGLKVYPFKTVEHGAVVSSSIVSQVRRARSLFGRRGVSGLANVDISPELAVRLAMAYATTMQKGARVVVSHDGSTAARMLKRALVAGLNASGVHVSDLDVTTVPVARFSARKAGPVGGLTVGLLYDEVGSVVIRLLNAEGSDIAEPVQREVERVFYREDFRRSLGADIGDVTYPAEVTEAYAQELVGRVDVATIRAASLRVVVDFSYGAASLVMPAVLSRLGAEVVSVNPYRPPGQGQIFDRWEHAGQVPSLVRATGAHLGAVIGPDGENLTLVDDHGHVLTDPQALLVLLDLALGPGGAHGAPSARRVALPVSAVRAAEKACQRACVPLVWTKLSNAHVMDVASHAGADFAAGQEGGYIFPGFLPAYDAVAALVHALGFLARRGLRLSDIVARLPEVRTAHEAVATPWEKRGLVMRSVKELAKDRPLVLVDGVKVIYDDGWALVVPDPEEALTHIWADADSDAGARRLVENFARDVRGVLRSS